MSDYRCERCNSPKHTLDNCPHNEPKKYTEAELQEKQVELLREILEEYKDDHINGNQDKKYSSIIQDKINKLEGK